MKCMPALVNAETRVERCMRDGDARGRQARQALSLVTGLSRGAHARTARLRHGRRHAICVHSEARWAGQAGGCVRHRHIHAVCAWREREVIARHEAAPSMVVESR